MSPFALHAALVHLRHTAKTSLREACGVACVAWESVSRSTMQAKRVGYKSRRRLSGFSVISLLRRTVRCHEAPAGPASRDGVPRLAGAPHSAPRCGLRAALQGPPSLGRLYKLSPVGKPQRERAPHLPADPLGEATGSLGARACAASGRPLSGPESAACLPHAGPPRDAADRDTRLLRDF